MEDRYIILESTKNNGNTNVMSKRNPFVCDNERVMDLLEKYGLEKVKEEENYFSDNPTHSGVICLSDFLQECFDQNIDIHYHRNRQRNESKINKIYQKLLIERKEKEGKYRYQTSTWCLYFATIKGFDAKLVDGAHRCEVTRRGLDDLYTQLKVYDFDDEKERWDFFLRINESSDLADIYRNTDEARQNFVKDFINNLQKYFGNSWIEIPEYKKRELITLSVPYITSIDESRFLELTNLIWPDNCSFVDDNQKIDKMVKVIKNMNEYLKKDLPKKLKVWSIVDKEAVADRCRAIADKTGKRCLNNLYNEDAKRRMKEGIFLCGWHTGIKFATHNICVNHEMIKKEARESGCYIGLIQTAEEWENIYNAVSKSKIN